MAATYQEPVLFWPPLISNHSAPFLPLPLLLSPPSLPQQNYRGLLVVKSVFLQPGISTGQHSVRTLHSLWLPYNSHAHVGARCLRCYSWNDPDWAATVPLTILLILLKQLLFLADKSFYILNANTKQPPWHYRGRWSGAGFVQDAVRLTFSSAFKEGLLLCSFPAP